MGWNLASGLEGRVVVVTGAAGGIGCALLQAFDAAGAHLVACDVNGPGLAVALSTLADSERHIGITADLGRAAEGERLVTEALRKFARLDILVNCAAVHLRLPMGEVDEEAWTRYLDANIKSVFFLSRAAARPMQAAHWGRIINFSSLAAYTGGYQQVTSVAYAATKGAVLTMTRSLAHILAPYNILVNAVAPGGVRTPMASTLSPEALMDYARLVPLGRLAEPNEIAAVVLFLASDHASFITGTVLDINGGAYNH